MQMVTYEAYQFIQQWTWMMMVINDSGDNDINSS